MITKNALHDLLEGMFYSALFITLLYLLLMLPSWFGIGALLLLLMPAIPAIHVLRQRFSSALGFALLSIGLIGLFTDWLMLAAVWLYCTGLGIGWGIKRQLNAIPPVDPTNRQALAHSALNAFFPGLCGAMLGLLLVVTLTPSLTGTTLITGIEAALDDGITQVLSMSSGSAELAQETVLSLYEIKDEIRVNLVFLLSCLALAITFLSFATVRFLLRHLGASLPPLPRFSLWQIPRTVMIILMITFVPLIFFEEASHWSIVLLSSVYQLVLLLVVFLGMAVLDFYLLLWHWPQWLRVVLRPMLLITPIMQSILLLLGMLDIGFDLRRLDAQMTNDK